MNKHQSIGEISAKYRNIISIEQENENSSLFGKFYLYIPTYQRPYSWKKKHIEQLLNDLHHQVMHFFDDDYFLGMIFTINKPSDKDDKMFEIVDGQQRLTTIFLLLTYLKLSFNNEKYGNYINAINKIRFSSWSEKDGQILEKIEFCKSLDQLFKVLKKEQKEAKNSSDLFYLQQIRIFKSGLITIHKFLRRDEVKSKLEEFYKYIFSKLKVLHITSEPDNLIGDQFFSSLNGKGLKLDQVDLLKSTFIHPYFYTKDSIEKFKGKWASLIKNTKNDMLNEISNYFSSYTKDKKKITPSKLNDHINKEWSNDTTIMKEFEKMCSFFEKYATFLDANTNDPIINFYVKLNQKFNFDKYKKVIYTAIMNTDNFSIDNSNDLKIIANILKSLFKINFIYLTVLERSAREFITNVINEYVKQNENLNANEINEKLSNQLDEILCFNNEIGEKFKNYNFNSKYDSLHYDSSKTNNYKILFLLNLIAETYNIDTKDIEYNKASNMIQYDIDHRVQKAEMKSLFYNNEDKKPVHPWKVENKEHKKIIKISNEYFDVFKDEEFNNKYQIKKNDMSWNMFIEMLNKPFNLKLLHPKDNQGKNSRSWLTKKELIDHFSISNEKVVKDKLIKAWNWIIYSSFELKNSDDDIDSNSSYIKTWRIIEQKLKTNLEKHGISKQDLESMRNEKGYLSKLVSLAFDKKIIENRDDFNLCKHILANRNKAIHDGANDKLNPDYKVLIQKFLEKMIKKS